MGVKNVLRAGVPGRVEKSVAPAAAPQEAVDVLGEDWVARTLELAPERREPVVATLVRPASVPQFPRAVLYVHGFSDYFFQAGHAQVWKDAEYDFYALDLRRYGRSIRPGQVPGSVRDLRAYGEEIRLALDVIRREHSHEKVVLLGHSTGGLIASLFAHDNPGLIDALVLNSPWFGLNEPWAKRVLARPMVELIAPLRPEREVGALTSDYSESIHSTTGGSWDFDLTWKPLTGFETRAGWLRAILRGHARVARGLAIEVPVLMCTSTRSGAIAGAKPTVDELRGADCVLDVRHMWGRAGRLGPDVTIRTIPGGRHDLALSEPIPRADFEHVVTSWTTRRLNAATT